MPRGQWMKPQRDMEIRRAPQVSEEDALARLHAAGAVATVQQKGRPAGFSKNAVKPRHLIVRTQDRVIRAMLRVDVEGRSRNVDQSDLERAEELIRSRQ